MSTDPDSWRTEAACLGMDTETFYPYGTESPMPAKRVCRTCPVRRECLLDALAEPATIDLGIRGGLTEAERRQLRRQRGERVAGCGTLGGFHAHYRRNEPACEPCAEARRAHVRDKDVERRQAVQEAVS